MELLLVVLEWLQTIHSNSNYQDLSLKGQVETLLNICHMGFTATGVKLTFQANDNRKETAEL